MKTHGHTAPAKTARGGGGGGGRGWRMEWQVALDDILTKGTLAAV